MNKEPFSWFRRFLSLIVGVRHNFPRVWVGGNGMYFLFMFVYGKFRSAIESEHWSAHGIVTYETTSSKTSPFGRLRQVCKAFQHCS